MIFVLSHQLTNLIKMGNDVQSQHSEYEDAKGQSGIYALYMYNVMRCVMYKSHCTK